MSTGGLIWGCLWRASLYGALLGAGFGGLFGGAFGTLVFPLVGTAIGFFYGALSGTVVGLPLGLLDGLLLLRLTIFHRKAAHPNTRRYRLQARIVCAAGSLFALMIDWAFHDLPDPDGFATDRALCLAFELDNQPLVTSCPASASMPPTAIDLTIVVFVPLFMALIASWLTGRFVSGWYAGKVSET